MKVLITGVAGFIGSAIARKHIALGDQVVGIDSFTDYYDTTQKRRNIENITSKLETLIEGDILDTDLQPLLDQTDVVYHQAGQPGVRKSWGVDFADYIRNNIAVTQVLLEAAKEANGLQKFVYASSSSIYGDSETYPTMESHTPAPLSPYGVTKLSAEHLCTLYGKNFGVPTISLRYFTVYGPGQRPDMAFHKFMKSICEGKSIEIYGDGKQIRDFTYVDDIVNGNILAGGAISTPGTVVNLAGGSSVSVNEVVELLSEITKREVSVKYIERLAGDVHRTGGSTAHAAALLNWEPKVSLEEGLAREWQWIEDAYSAANKVH